MALDCGKCPQILLQGIRGRIIGAVAGDQPRGCADPLGHQLSGADRALDGCLGDKCGCADGDIGNGYGGASLEQKRCNNDGNGGKCPHGGTVADKC